MTVSDHRTDANAGTDATVGADNPPGGTAGKPAPSTPVRPELPTEIGGAPGPEPTRYGDWQHKGRVTDF